VNHLDNDEILRRRNEFFGQVNNVLCFTSKFESCTVYELFQSHCRSLFCLFYFKLQDACYMVYMAVISGYSATFTLKSYAYIMAKRLTYSPEITVQNSLLSTAVIESMFVVRRRDL
jgi:hypothetical protein